MQTTPKIQPLDDNVIVRIIDKDEEKIGMLYVPKKLTEESTLAEVLVPPRFSYHRCGRLRDSQVKAGMKVRLPKGAKGTEMPEAPDGEKWLCIPEDVIYYIIEEQDNG